MKSQRRSEIFRQAVLASALLAVIAAGFVGSTNSLAAPAAAQRLGPKPPIAKACGSIQVRGQQLRVDITETLNMKARTCGTARQVMRRFVRTSPEVMGDGVVRYRGRKYNCYRARPDGEGWEYHCGWSNFSGGAGRSINFGAGRRF